MMTRADTVLIYALITLSLNQIVYLSPILNTTQTNDVILEENESRNNLSMDEGIMENNATSLIYEEIKSRILKSLHKAEAPKKLAPLPRLQSLTAEDNWTNYSSSEINTSNTKTDIALADVEKITSNGVTFLNIHFNLPEVNDIESAELWLYKREGVRDYTLAHVSSVNDKEKQKSAFHINNQEYEAGWTRFDVSLLIIADNYTGLEFQVSEEEGTKLGTKGNNTPFLIIHKMMGVKNISKRSTANCTNESTNDSSPCCLYELYVNFEEVDYDNWIIYPPGYYANYCKGTCDISNLSTHRARIMNALCEKKPQKAAELGINECVSCGPTGYGPISMVYKDEDGIQLASNLPDMSITECGCT